MLINLHTHLEGRVRPSTAAALASSAGLDAGIDWQRALELDAPSDLTDYLAKVSSSYPFFGSRDSLTRIAREAVEDAHADGQDYLELRFGPATHVRDGFGLSDVIAAVCEGVKQGTAITGMPAGVVVAALRLHDAAANESVARAAARFAGDGVVGFDLAGDEARFPDLRPFAEAFAIARAAGLGLTCHAAEAAPAGAALEAVELLGVTRIGHGAHIVDDPEVLARVVDAGVAVEVCPTSNLYTGAVASLAVHPAGAFREAGVAVVLGDDNPRQTGSPLSREHALLADTLGFDTSALDRLAADSIRVGFMEEHVRSALAGRAG
ncbi:adenosine deaminase [Leifsonia sp. 71-9]|uniref:adenosine deaminase n=1 Tax=Leifsonia sp. 71-9 TaxID=1895934 RepID=UPI000929376D|nr:adenosine deaminase [Leifsonia sp. 71-9]OJX75318.1 MAG: adenosine deaminase [Leifsonia sp. 71-9]